MIIDIIQKRCIADCSAMHLFFILYFLFIGIHRRNGGIPVNYSPTDFTDFHRFDLCGLGG